MNRRKFLTMIPVAVTAVVIAPKLLISEEPVKLLPLQVYTSTWLQKAEWEFAKDWHKQRKIAWMQYNMSMINIQSYINEQTKLS